MLPELGYFALILATVVAVFQVGLSLWGELFKRPQLLSLNPLFSGVQALCCTVSFGALAHAFLSDDFSVIYVAQHSNSQLPDFFKFAATWGGHEGSMLFWLTALTLWTSVFCIFSDKSDRLFNYRTQAMLGLISLGFMLFILLVSNPFERSFPPPPEGRDLNPMLQDVGLIFHPPLLYLGYVGFAVSFAMIVASLLSGVLDAATTRWIRPWAMISWGFLTAGIILGAWWAYYELGWGGWWFWDPVENASLMPWLLGTALIHSLIVSEQRGIFSYWTILLAIFAFALSLLGTFIVRSGVLTSVHAFAVDPDRGMALLILFFSLSFIALALFAFRVNLWQGEVRFRLFSKETGFLLLNGLLTIATCAVVLGTFYPMIFTAMSWGSISVGAPYFNSIFAPLAVFLMLAMGLAVILRWKQIPLKTILLKLALLPIALGFAVGLIQHTIAQTQLYQFELLPLLFVTLAMWIILTHIPYLQYMWQIRPLAMRLAHIGFAICVIGAMMNSYYGDEIGVRLKPDQQANLAGFTFRYEGYRDVIGANYTAEQAIFSIAKAGEELALVAPERRYYDVRTMTMAEVGLYHHGLDDVYIVMGDKFGNLEYAFRLHYKPYVRALWLGGIMMVIASILALFGYRRK
ncbi:heme lyase NrfEFG subunit NrfE [Actinobacillus equuli]|uniref:Cytochrome c-type biogenesis protein n=1 Tax=Actinobacillus equuli TaxID=718 RepID=A0AAX3FKJ2_ACTEU|nr:heme lyase NrfEFG subunit NrfE [Actinobacillus equuli]AIZ78368.1 cytochrome C biogenesis protein CcmF [Actinobacillus equuli subsp. equuli]WGE44639.1 heme lyase NrfEFG subunit NrfE [Actinobacillus equuli subsp. equuli]VEE92186.1 cytochrome c-type biogenesis protein [Actinobacillus equuli]